jgi:hypothetical protein
MIYQEIDLEEIKDGIQNLISYNDVPEDDDMIVFE